MHTPCGIEIHLINHKKQGYLRMATPEKRGSNADTFKLTYQIPLPEELYDKAENLLRITKKYANIIIAKHWTEEDIEALDAWKRKKYKFFGDKDFAADQCYLPSRIRRES